MDIEKLIEQYRQAADKWEKRNPVTDTFDLRVQDALRDAATALSTLQIENQALRNSANGFKAENEKLRAENIMHHNAADNYYAELTEYMQERNEALAELEQVKAERDAAVEDVAGILAKAELIRREIGYCLDYESDNKLANLCIDYCKGSVFERCYEEREDGGCNNFLWRGLKED